MKFLKENWFKLGVLICAVFATLWFSVFYGVRSEECLKWVGEIDNVGDYQTAHSICMDSNVFPFIKD